MKRLRLAVPMLALLAFSAPAISLTAVCQNPTGRMMGIHGKAFGGRAFDEPDGISRATFTLI